MSFSAIMPAAPVLFSTTTGWPSAACIFAAISRAGTSLGPPAGKPTSSRIGFEGNDWAKASAPIAVSAASASDAVSDVRTTAVSSDRNLFCRAV